MNSNTDESFDLQAEGLTMVGNSNTERWQCLRVGGLSSVNALASISISDFIRFTTLANETTLRAEERFTGPEIISQREQRKSHAQELANYFLGAVATRIFKDEGFEQGVRAYANEVLKCIKRQDFYSMQPVTLNYDPKQVGTSKKAGNEDPTFTLTFSTGYKFGLADGGHRKKAGEYLQEMIRQTLEKNELPKSGFLSPTAHRELNVKAPLDDHAKYTKIDALKFWEKVGLIFPCIEVAAMIQPIHGNIEFERQSFSDMTDPALKLAQGQTLLYDQSSPINRYLEQTGTAPIPPLSDKDIVNWTGCGGKLARKHAVAISTYVIRGRGSQKGMTQSMFEPKMSMLEEFWTCASSLPGVGEDGGRNTSVAAQPVVLKAIARLTWEIAFGIEKKPELAVTKLNELHKLGKNDGFFGHDKEHWLPYINEDQIKNDKHIPFLPPSTGVNRNLGSKDSEGRVRYGAKHNDIVTILVDVLRCELGLDPKKNRGPSS